ncbi:hypothetical protein PGTUg99_014252 [Puccinia graminis f. sp. tritici]|uniref:CCHC-type domain-containing protein n=1 Tax=Puccinia graminis f. sp. tritici TaxID=56615 RepID=A0A5B0NXQ0_PUCGR|nr:hypothetical protein PGTUg99_014252 [Puccinia graminis f. sp. tritici]
MNIGKVEHSPKGKSPMLPGDPGVRPKPPADQEYYSKEEVQGMSPEERQWMKRHPYLVRVPEDELIDYEEDSVGSSSKTAGRIEESLTKALNQMHVDPPRASTSAPAQEPAHTPHHEYPRPAPVPEEPALVLHQETDVSKVLRSWPDKECPKFIGSIGDSASDWIRTMSVLLKDRQAHPGVWHIAAGQRLSGKAFRDWTDAAYNGTRPESWETFKVWLGKQCTLGVTPEIVAAEFDRLRQEPNELCQAFYKRFCEWQVRAKAINFGHDERTAFVKRLTPGLSAKVSNAMTAEQIRGTPMTMDQVFVTAVAHDRHHQDSQAAPVAGGLSKRRAAGEGAGSEKKKSGFACHNCKKTGHSAKKCPEPKTEAQLAWEAANQAKLKKKEKE